MNYLCHILAIVCIFSMLSSSLNLVLGYGGVLTVAHAALYGIGAYTTAILMLRLDCPFFLSLLGAMVICGALGAAIAFPSLRIRGDHFIVTTFALQVVVYSLFSNWRTLTGGPMGLYGIPAPVLLGWRVDTHPRFLILALLFACLVQFVIARLAGSPFGRALRGVREDEHFSEAMGKSTLRFKCASFLVSAMLAAAAGSLYATYTSYIDPSSFTVMESIFVISLVIIGGAGSLWGPVIGAVVLVSLPEVLRLIGLPSTVAANLRQMLYGAALVGCMLWRPRGLMGDFSFQRDGKI